MAGDPRETTCRILFRLLAPEYPRLQAALVLTLAAAAVEFTPMALLAWSAGRFMVGAEGAFGWVAALLAGALLLKYLLYSLAYYCSHVAAYGLLAHIRRDLVHLLSGAPLPWLQLHGSGDLKKVVLQDVERLEQFIAHHSVECLAAMVSPLCVCAVLGWIDWRLAVAAVLTAPVAGGLQAVLMRGLARTMERYNDAVGALNGAMVEYIRNAPVMKTFCLGGGSFRRLRDLLLQYHHLVTAITRRTVPGWAVFTVVLRANIVVLLPVSLWLVRQGEITPADAVMAIMLGSGMLAPLFKVAHFGSEIREILAGLRRIAPILAFTPSPVSQYAAVVPSGDVAFAGVGLSLGCKAILKSLDFTLPQGAFTALVGPSGAGKSTVANLLNGLLLPERGEIRIGTTPLDSLDDAVRSRVVATASQESFLFLGSVLDNLRLGKPDAGLDEVRMAVRVAQAEDLIAELPDGYDTVVGERGCRLSGGERQRLAIARALLVDAPILILDEATAFADSRTERRFYDALRGWRPRQTVLVIAHRLQAIERADRILVLRDGSLEDHGTHAELLDRCPLYQNLWHRQFASENWSIRCEVKADVALP